MLNAIHAQEDRTTTFDKVSAVSHSLKEIKLSKASQKVYEYITKHLHLCLFIQILVLVYTATIFCRDLIMRQSVEQRSWVHFLTVNQHSCLYVPVSNIDQSMIGVLNVTSPSNT